MVLCDSIDSARRELGLKKSEKRNWDNGTIGMYYVDRGKSRNKFSLYLFVNVAKHTDVYDLLNTINHEANHLTNKILQYVDIVVDYDNDEAHTYLQAYIFEAVFKFFVENQDKLSIAKTKVIIQTED